MDPIFGNSYQTNASQGSDHRQPSPEQIAQGNPIFQMAPQGFQAEFGGEQYERLSHRDQIRLRPDTYIGSPAGIANESIWYAELAKNAATDFVPIKIYNANAQISPAIIGISKEGFDNISDNIERSRVEGIDPGIPEIEMTQNSICLRNYGKHIPVVVHHKEKIWTPHMIFGVLLTSDNYNDSIDRYKIGRNGYGIKLTNIFSIIFKVVIGDPVKQLKYTQIWQNGMLNVSEPLIENYTGPGFTEITFVPDFPYFYEGVNVPPAFLESMQGYYLARTIQMSYAAQVVTRFNGIELDYRAAETFFEAHMETKNPLRKQIYWKSPDGNDEFIIADMPNKGFQIGFVNGVPVHQGEHINEYIRVIFEKLAEKFEKDHKKKVTIVHIKPHVGLVVRCKLDKPSFDSQIKRKLVKPKPKINLPKKIQTDILKWDGLDEELKKKFALKTKSEINKKKQKARVKKLHDATMAGVNGESWKCTLILTEGETGCTLALNGNKYLPGGCQYNGVYPLRGKFINVDRHTEEKVDANQELSDIMEILKAEKGVDYTKPENFNKLRYGKIMFMTDADDDGQHIQGLGIKFIFTYLRSIAPFQFTLALLTPIVLAKHKKTHQVLKFYYHKQFLNWQKTQTPEDLKDWDIDYKKGLGSWTANDDKVLQDIFVSPIIITYAVDPQTDDMLKLAFDKKMTDERKQWISSYDINSQPNYNNPRPITDFFQEEFRAFCKTTVTRAIPALMDGMKSVHRKVLYAMFLKFGGAEKKKSIKLIQFAGFVMEKAGYHFGDTALYDSIIGMGQNYLTGPNNLALVQIDGNAGDRRLKGKDASPPRYLKVNLHPIAHYIYRKEDWPLLNILYDEGDPIEPEVMYPVIPMCIVNRTLGIASGWSTNIPPHNPFTVCDWIIAWVVEKKSKRDVPLNELIIDVANKPELIPWWKGYQGEIRRIANKPHEKFLNLGAFRSQMHVTYVTELPVETSIEAYKLWLVKEEGVYDETPEKAILRTFDNNSIMPNVDFRIYGMHEPTYEKLHLVRTIAMSNMTLIDTKGIPTKYDFLYEILCAWCPERLDIYEKRRKHKLGDLEKDLRMATLRWMFIDDVLNKRIILEKRQKSDYIPLMEAKGYPCNKKRDGDDFTLMPMKIVTTERLKKLEKEIGHLREQILHYSTVWAEDLWLSDLQELRVQIERLYSKGFF